MSSTTTKADVALSIAELLKTIRSAEVMLHVRKFSSRACCKYCKCFLSLNREEPTGFHQKFSDGRIEFVIVYYGKTYCMACHRFQVES